MRWNIYNEINFGSKCNLLSFNYAEKVKTIYRDEDLVEYSNEDSDVKGAFEVFYRFSSGDRSGQLVSLHM